MFTNNFKLDGIDSILEDIGYMDEMKGAGEDQEHKYKKSGKKSKDYDDDGTVEDESDEYAGVKDRAIKKATGKCKECGKKPCECEDEMDESCGGTHGKKKKKMVEDVDFSTVLDELTDEDILFLTDDLIEEVVEEFFYETLEEGFEIEELETILLEQVESQLEYLEEAKVTVGHDSDVKPEASRTSKLAKVKDAVKKVASGAKAVAKKVAGAAGEVAGSAVAGYKKASAAAQDAPSATKSDSNASKSDSPNTGTRSSGGATGTKRPGLLGRIASGLKSGLKKAIHGAGKVAGKVVKTAKAGYDEGRGKTAPASSSAPAAKPAAKPAPKAATPAAKQASAKKKSKSNLDNLLNQIRNEQVQNIEEKAPPGAKYERMVKHIKKSYSKGGLTDKEKSIAYATAWKAKKANEEVEFSEGLEEACWKGYKAVGMKMKNGKKVPNCVPMEEYVDLERDMLEEGYTFEQVLEVIAAYEDGFEVIFEEDGVTINETQEVLDEVSDRLAKAARNTRERRYNASFGDGGPSANYAKNDAKRKMLNKSLEKRGIKPIPEEYIDEETQFLSDVEMVADWLQAEGIIQNEDQFFELMEDLSQEEIEELYDVVLEATAMAKRGHDETAIRNKIAANTGGGKSADRATALEKKPTYGNDKAAKQRSELARKQRGDFRKTTSSSPGLHGYGHKSNDPDVKAKQAARGKQRGVLTPNEKKELNMGYEMIGSSLEEGGLEVRNYSWKEVMEAQEARNNPEKYEAGQKKKYAPVRGEKTPMPPRGDKRREDFEKWYAANVR